MTALGALSILRLCQTRGVQLIPDGSRLVLRGPKVERDRLRSLIAEHKMELLGVLAAPPTVQITPLPADRPGQEWARDYLGRPVNLWGKRPQGGGQ